MSAIKTTISDQVKDAMRNKDKQRLSALRLIMAAIKQFEVDNRGTDMTDEQVIVVLDKSAKQRRQSIEQYQAAKRDDLVAQEQFELELLQTFLPKALSEEEINTIITKGIDELGASSIKDMGKVMGKITSQLKGRADMAQVSQQVKERLQ